MSSYGESRTMRRWWLILGIVGILTLLVAVWPYVVAIVPPLRTWALRQVLPKMHGTATASSASLSWMSPVEFNGVVIHAPDGTLVATIERLRGDRPLWKYYLRQTSDLGTYELDHPHLHLVLAEHGSNLRQTFAVGRKRSGAALGISIVGGDFSLREPTGEDRWRIRGINVSLELRPSTATSSKKGELILHPGGVVEHVPITPQVTRDLLGRIAPMLAGPANVSGHFSLRLNQWRLPLSDLKDGQGAGTLIIHSAHVTPGPLARALAAALNLPAAIQVPNNMSVPFRMAHRRIYQRNLQFDIGDVTVQTHGSVGLDQSLNLMAAVHLPKHMPSNTLLTKVLEGRTIDVPIHGSINQPQINFGALARANAGTFLGMIEQSMSKQGRS